jgi:hypothetical protein
MSSKAWKRLFLLADFPPKLTLPWDNYVNNTFKSYYISYYIPLIDAWDSAIARNTPIWKTDQLITKTDTTPNT